MFLEYTKGAN